MAARKSKGQNGGRSLFRVNYLSELLHGRMLSTDFLSHNWMTIFIVVAIIFIYITNKYQCQTRMETIQKLEHRLEVVNSECVRQKSRYMSHIRESSMQQMVDSMHLDLHVQEYPPFTIKYDR